MAVFKKIGFVILFIKLSLPLFSQVPFHKNAFYLVCRGSNQKLSMIADFNIQDKEITHVGIGILENGKLWVYHVTNDGETDSALICQSLDEFQAIQDIHYLSIWEYRCSKKEVVMLQKTIGQIALNMINFDMDFNPLDDNRLYCSEFCAKMLMLANPEVFEFPLTQKPLQNFYRTVLNREILSYYPVDFFESNRGFHKIYEKYSR